MIASLSSSLLWKLIGGLAIIAAIGTLYGLWQSASSRADMMQIERDEAASRAVLAERRNRVLEQAAQERATDTREIAALERNLTNAIDQAEKTQPGRAPGPATTAANCERLRQAGRTSTDAYRRVCR